MSAYKRPSFIYYPDHKIIALYGFQQMYRQINCVGGWEAALMFVLLRKTLK